VSPKDKKFVNPMLRSTESSPETQTETTPQTATQPSMKTHAQDTTEVPTETTTSPETQSATDTSTSTIAETFTYTPSEYDEILSVARRNRGKQAFGNTHDRWTVWLHKKLKRGISKLAKEQDASISALADEAVADLLKKYGK
jgi:alpha-L-arabinofuranosidase